MTELDGRRPAGVQPQQLWLFSRESRRPGAAASSAHEALTTPVDRPTTVVTWLAEDMELDPVCTFEFACHAHQLHHQQRARRD